MLYNVCMTKPKAAQLVQDRFIRARSYRTSTQDDTWRKSYNNWRGVHDTASFPWRSKVFVPWSFTVVETIIPKVFAREPKWRVVPISPDTPPEQATVINDLLTYQWQSMGMRIKMYDYIKDSLMYSKGYVKVGWKFKTKTTTVEEPIVGEDDKITFETVEKTAIEHDDPCVDVIDPMDIYVDPDATSLDDATYVIHRTTKTIEKLRDNPNYKNLDKIKESSADEYLDKQYRYRGATPTPDKHNDLVEVLEYWERDRLIVVANRSVVLRDSPNPYAHKELPFVELDDYRDPHKYYGQSELSVIAPLQSEINSIRNQRRDYDNLALNPVVRMVPGTLRNPNSARMSPGNVWLVSDLQSMDIFQLPQLQGSSTQIENQTAGDIKMTTAIDEIGIGLLPEGQTRRSATEIVTASTMAGKRFAVKIALLEEAVKRIGQLVYALDQQFLDTERVIQITGENGGQRWVKLDGSDIRGRHDISVEVGSMLPKDEVAQRQEAVELLQYVTPIVAPILQQNPGILYPILRMIVDTYDLPGRQEVLEELKEALGVASDVAQEENEARIAQQQAGALATAQQALAPQEMAPEELVPEDTDVNVPQTAQGQRADLEVQMLLSGEA